MKYWRMWSDFWDNLTESKKVRSSKVVIPAIIILYFGSMLLDPIFYPEKDWLPPLPASD